MVTVRVSPLVEKDFQDSDFYMKQMSKETAHWLLEGFLDRFYQYAVKRGWTKAKSVSEYVEKDHGPIFTAAFLLTC